jgi:hypothetical protein
VLWALAQPAAMAGLVAAFVLGVGVRAMAQSLVAHALAWPSAGPGEERPGEKRRGAGMAARHSRFCPVGVLAAAMSGTGWGRESTVADRRVVLAGPLAVLGASQAAFVAYHTAYPGPALALRLYRPSDVLHGAVAQTVAAQLMISVAVGLLCFGVLALLPVPPFDGYRLFPPAASAGSRVVERLTVVAVLVLLVVPVAGRPPLLAALDAVAGPVVRAWA